MTAESLMFTRTWGCQMIAFILNAVVKDSKITKTTVKSTIALNSFIAQFEYRLRFCYLKPHDLVALKERRTDSIVDKLILYAINRGAATSIAALMNLILFVSVPNTFIFMIFLEPSSQLYVLSVTSMLTSREALRTELKHATNNDHVSIPMQSSQAKPKESETIHVQRTVVTWRDGHSETLDLSRELESKSDLIHHQV
ncbi:hypothetical protein C0995_008249 [Termitomyces sp. Mi166|nr:hypothetical protein C0995_008249 [Termitomyces sp. Mi166\